VLKRIGNGGEIALPPFYEEIEVSVFLWATEFDYQRVLTFDAPNGDPVRYEMTDEATQHAIVFRRKES
jgi:hypothetical protein